MAIARQSQKEEIGGRDAEKTTLREYKRSRELCRTKKEVNLWGGFLH